MTVVRLVDHSAKKNRRVLFLPVEDDVAFHSTERTCFTDRIQLTDQVACMTGLQRFFEVVENFISKSGCHNWNVCATQLQNTIQGFSGYDSAWTFEARSGNKGPVQQADGQSMSPTPVEGSTGSRWLTNVILDNFNHWAVTATLSFFLLLAVILTWYLSLRVIGVFLSSARVRRAPIANSKAGFLESVERMLMTQDELVRIQDDLEVCQRQALKGMLLRLAPGKFHSACLALLLLRTGSERMRRCS